MKLLKPILTQFAVIILFTSTSFAQNETQYEITNSIVSGMKCNKVLDQEQLKVEFNSMVTLSEVISSNISTTLSMLGVQTPYASSIMSKCIVSEYTNYILGNQCWTLLEPSLDDSNSNFVNLIAEAGINSPSQSGGAKYIFRYYKDLEVQLWYHTFSSTPRYNDNADKISKVVVVELKADNSLKSIEKCAPTAVVQ